MHKLSLIGLTIICSPLFAITSPELNTARIAYYNDKDFTHVKNACLEGIKKGQINFEFYAILSGSEINLGNWQPATQAFIKAYEIDSAKLLDWTIKKGGGSDYFYQAFYFAARESFESEKHNEAFQDLKFAELLNPADIATFILRGAILYKLGDIEAANKEYQKVLDRDPENPDVYFLVGRALFEGKSFHASIDNFTNAEKYYRLKYGRISSVISQNVPEINKGLRQKIIRLWAEEKSSELNQLIKMELKFENGLDALEMNVEQYFKITMDLARCYYFVGMAYYELKEESLGLNNLLKSLDLNPDDLDGLFYAGEIYLKSNKFPDALTYFERVTQLKEDDLYAWFYLGVCYTQLKNYNKAIEIYENRVLKLDPKNIDVLTNLIYICNALGNKEKAFEYSEQLEKIKKEKL